MELFILKLTQMGFPTIPKQKTKPKITYPGMTDIQEREKKHFGLNKK